MVSSPSTIHRYLLFFQFVLLLFVSVSSLPSALKSDSFLSLTTNDVSVSKDDKKMKKTTKKKDKKKMTKKDKKERKSTIRPVIFPIKRTRKPTSASPTNTPAPSTTISPGDFPNYFGDDIIIIEDNFPQRPQRPRAPSSPTISPPSPTISPSDFPNYFGDDIIIIEDKFPTSARN